ARGRRLCASGEDTGIERARIAEGARRPREEQGERRECREAEEQRKRGAAHVRRIARSRLAWRVGVARPLLRAQNSPTPRWSILDCAKAPGTDPISCADGGALNVTIQERAWTSPIWFSP